MAGNSEASSELENLSINTIRILSAEMVEAAQSGHPGMPMGMAAIAYVLWKKFLNFNPKAPQWASRDRFVLSNGHGSALLYSMLHLTGYKLALDDIKRFRQLGSPCAGHPEFGEIEGIETTTGPLGQGVSVAVGMAMAERYLGAQFNRPGFPLIDHHVYCFVGDGCLMEGISGEAASLAGHLGLGKLIVIWDSNHISIDGSTDLAFTENVLKRYDAYGWQTIGPVDGLDTKAIEEAIHKAKADGERPTLIEMRTHIGYGAPKKQDTADAHGAPLGAEELKAAKQRLGWTQTQPFSIPAEVNAHMHSFAQRGERKCNEWEMLLSGYCEKFPAEGKLLKDAMLGSTPAALLDMFQKDAPKFTPEADKALATRAASGKVMNALAKMTPLFWGGSADLAESNSTHLKDGGDFEKANAKGRNIRFGVREHAMGAIVSGLAHSRMLIPFGATFMTFSDYMRPSIRLAALMGLPTVYVFTHESIFLGEDGPTHQPIEHYAALRAIPNLRVIRPADAKETVAAWHYVLQSRKGGPHGTPVALCLSRQKLNVLAGTKDRADESVARGAYVIQLEKAALKLLLIGTGSEVELCCQVAAQLEAKGIGTRVVSMPCRELFLEQSESYREQVLPARATKRMVVEAAHPQGWEGIAGSHGLIYGITRFGASAPAAQLAEFFGYTPAKLVERALAYLA